MQVAQ